MLYQEWLRVDGDMKRQANTSHKGDDEGTGRDIFCRKSISKPSTEMENRLSHQPVHWGRCSHCSRDSYLLASGHCCA